MGTSATDPAAPFIGFWKLLPKECAFEHGEPPVAGSYTISRKGTELQFSVEASLRNGRKALATYSCPVTGEMAPLAGQSGRDAVRAWFEGAASLWSAFYHSGQEVERWERRLLEDGRLELIQSGTHEGQSFRNVSVYRKVG